MSSSWSFVYLFFDILLSHSFFVQVNGIIFGDDEWMTPTRIPPPIGHSIITILSTLYFQRQQRKWNGLNSWSSSLAHQFLIYYTHGHFDSVVHDKVTNSPIGHRGWWTVLLLLLSRPPTHSHAHTLRNDQLITGQFTRLGLVCLAGRCCRRCDRCPLPRRTWWSAFDPQPLQP